MPIAHPQHLAGGRRVKRWLLPSTASVVACLACAVLCAVGVWSPVARAERPAADAEFRLTRGPQLGSDVELEAVEFSVGDVGFRGPMPVQESEDRIALYQGNYVIPGQTVPATGTNTANGAGGTATAGQGAGQVVSWGLQRVPVIALFAGLMSLIPPKDYGEIGPAPLPPPPGFAPTAPPGTELFLEPYDAGDLKAMGLAFELPPSLPRGDFSYLTAVAEDPNTDGPGEYELLAWGVETAFGVVWTSELTRGSFEQIEVRETGVFAVNPDGSSRVLRSAPELTKLEKRGAPDSVASSEWEFRPYDPDRMTPEWRPDGGVAGNGVVVFVDKDGQEVLPEPVWVNRSTGERRTGTHPNPNLLSPNSDASPESEDPKLSHLLRNRRALSHSHLRALIDQARRTIEAENPSLGFETPGSPGLVWLALGELAARLDARKSEATTVSMSELLPQLFASATPQLHLERRTYRELEAAGVRFDATVRRAVEDELARLAPVLADAAGLSDNRGANLSVASVLAQLETAGHLAQSGVAGRREIAAILVSEVALRARLSGELDPEDVPGLIAKLWTRPFADRLPPSVRQSMVAGFGEPEQFDQSTFAATLETGVLRGLLSEDIKSSLSAISERDSWIRTKGISLFSAEMTEGAANDKGGALLRRVLAIDPVGRFLPAPVDDRDYVRAARAGLRFNGTLDGENVARQREATTFLLAPKLQRFNEFLRAEAAAAGGVERLPPLGPVEVEGNFVVIRAALPELGGRELKMPFVGDPAVVVAGAEAVSRILASAARFSLLEGSASPYEDILYRATGPGARLERSDFSVQALLRRNLSGGAGTYLQALAVLTGTPDFAANEAGVNGRLDDIESSLGWVLARRLSFASLADLTTPFKPPKFPMMRPGGGMGALPDSLQRSISGQARPRSARGGPFNVASDVATGLGCPLSYDCSLRDFIKLSTEWTRVFLP